MAFTQQDLVTLERAIASGAQQVRYADRTVTYQSTADMQRARKEIAAELGVELAPPRRRMFRVTQTGNGY